MSLGSIELEGLDELLSSIDKIADEKRAAAALGKACAIVERAAREKAPKGEGELRRSIASKVDGLEGIVFTPLVYAPYVEYGTGIYAEKEGRAGYWVYVDEKDESDEARDKVGKMYTLEEAKSVTAWLREQGKEAYYTNGQRPRPYMRPALEENREKVLNKIKEGIIND